MFSPAHISMLIEAADCTMRALILLAVNGGLGNGDLALLPTGAIDFDRAIIDFPRPKSGIERRVPLWPETIDAIRASIAARPQPKESKDARLVFLTRDGLPLVRLKTRYKAGHFEGSVTVNGLSYLFSELLKKTGIRTAEASRQGLNFYGLRRTFRTVADEVSRDQHAIHRIMGHAIAGMSGVYVQRISDDRLKAVTDAVREKLLTITPPCSAPYDHVAVAADLIAEALNNMPA